MRFAPEGIPFFLVGLALAGAGWTLYALGYGGRLAPVLATVFSVLLLFTLWFFRNPAPDLPADVRAVVSPGEGKVIGIEEVDEPTFMGGRARKISIFLSVFDVHVQRAPVSGVVAHRSYRPGKYAVAWLEKASEDNEQASLGLMTPDGKVLVRQIAGLIARRIITDPHEGEEVERGARIGLIRFGSRVEVYIPLHWEVTASVGDRVRVGSTVLAVRP